MEALVIGSLGVIALFAIKGAGINVRDDFYQVTGASDMTRITKPSFVDRSHEFAVKQDGRDAQIQNGKTVVRGGKMDDQTFQVGDIYQGNFGKAMKESNVYLQDHPASIPISSRKHGKKPTLRVDCVGRSLQYSGAAELTYLAPISLSTKGGQSMPDQVRAYTDLARSAKSSHIGTISSRTVPYFRVDPDSPHNSQSYHTRSKLGQTALSVY